MKNENKLSTSWRASSGSTSEIIAINKLVVNTIETVVNRYKTADPFLIANSLNIEIDWSDFGPHPLGETTYFRNQPIVLLNNEIMYSPQRFFTMGHELGHVILHEGYGGYQTGRLSQGVLEHQANEFASGLMGMLYVEENGRQPDCYIDLVHAYGSPVNELD
ncbi:ImmA/IrrE family metallo-endopeptidase [Lentilactobacillus buchneri]|uniref:ImmA/IrrE family metallo-endopeptidase n=1 Tax=Lentilactobacillus buchneri TaxID=1581 RepID=UPI0021A2BDA9|nr:ImmA/IrrE family metallo-endopeptidase [Lentilactobacillus buchneri]MCT2882632.1 ImmA/IrrE family metallo-endopeptidase [Lentilactobacillus buchneri]